MSHPLCLSLFDLQHLHWTHALQTLLDVSCAMFACFFSYSCSHRCCICTWKNVLTIRVWCVQCPSIALDWNKAHKLCIRLQQDSSWKTCLQSQNPTKISSMLNLGLNQIISCSVDAICAVQEDIGRVVEELSGGFTLCQWRSPSIFTCKNLMKTPRLLVQIVPSNYKPKAYVILCHIMSCSWPQLLWQKYDHSSSNQKTSLLHRVRTPWVAKFQCRSVSDFLILRTQRNKIRKTAPQACPQAIMWAEWTLGIRGKVTMCTVATQFGFEFEIIVMNPTWRQMIGGVFENVSHESTLSLDHLGGWHRMPKACIHLKALWNSQNWRECSLFWSEFQCRSIRKQSSVNPGFNSSNVWQIKCQSWKAQTWSWEFCHQKRLRKVQAKYVFDCCADLPSTRIWSPGI